MSTRGRRARPRNSLGQITLTSGESLTSGKPACCAAAADGPVVIHAPGRIGPDWKDRTRPGHSVRVMRHGFQFLDEVQVPHENRRSATCHSPCLGLRLRCYGTDFADCIVARTCDNGLKVAQTGGSQGQYIRALGNNISKRVHVWNSALPIVHTVLKLQALKPTPAHGCVAELQQVSVATETLICTTRLV